MSATAEVPRVKDEPENPLHTLTPEQIESIGQEFDAIHDDVFGDLGERDAKYIRGMIDLHRRLALVGRAVLGASRFKPMWARLLSSQQHRRLL